MPAPAGNAIARAAVDIDRGNPDATGVRRILLALFAATALACRREPLHEYPKDVVDNFLGACRANGASDDACQCSLDGLRRRFTADEYMALEKKVQARDEAATRLLSEVAADCRD